MTSNAPHAAAYRARTLAKARAANKRGEALNKIIARLEGNNKPLAIELRAIATDGLADPQPGTK